MSLVLVDEAGHVEEEFVTFDAFPNYAVSNYGRVVNINTGRDLTPYRQPNGYWKVDLCRKGVRRTFYLHRLVAKAFLVDYDPGLGVTHRDGNKQDCSVMNIEMGEPCRTSEEGLW